MADEKFTATDIAQTLIPIPAKGDSSLATTDPELSQQITKAIQLQQQNIQSLISLIGQLQGRFPPETDQKLQAFLQQLNQQNQAPIVDESQLKQATTTFSATPALNQHQQIVLTQLSQLLAKQPQIIPQVLLAAVRAAPEQSLVKTLGVLMTEQTPAWQSNQPLNQKAMDWLLQSTLSLSSKTWPQLPAKIQTLLVQSGFSAPTTPLSRVQSQYINQANERLITSLVQQSSVVKDIQQQIQTANTKLDIDQVNTTTKSQIEIPSKAIEQNNTQPNQTSKLEVLQRLLPLAKMTQVAGQQLQQLLGKNSKQETVVPNDSNKVTEKPIGDIKSPEVSTLTRKGVEMPATNLIQEIGKNIAGLKVIIDNSSSISLPKTVKESLGQMTALIPKDGLAIEEQKVVSRPQWPEMIKTIKENPLIQAQQQPDKVSSQRMTMLLENAIHQIKAKPNTHEASIHRIGLYQLSPQLKTDTHRAKIAEVFEIPDSDDNWEKLVTTSKPIRSQIQSILQNITQLETKLSSQPTEVTAKNIAAQDDFRVNAITKETHQPLAKWQQLLSLALKQNMTLLSNTAGNEKNTASPISTLALPSISTSSPAQLLSTQLTQPLQTPEQIQNWFQFLLQPLASDNAFSKSLQLWLFQLLQQRSQQKRTASELPTILKTNPDDISFDKLGKILEHSVTQPKTTSQNSQQQSQAQITPTLSIPLPPSHDEPEQLNHFELRRNIRSDEQRGWQIAMNLDLGQKGKIRLQARMTFPDIALSILAEKGETIDLIKNTYPVLSERFGLYGLKLQKPILRQGKIDITKQESPPDRGFSVKV